MTAARIARDEYMVWSAHFTGEAHICSPEGCGYPQADATQWTDKYDGVRLDASLCYGYFFAGPPVVKPVAPPVVVKPPVKPPVGPVEPPVVHPPVVGPPKPGVPPKPVVTLVYVKAVLDAAAGKTAGYPEGTILFIPHNVTTQVAA
jgi:hypothetical protein